MLDPNLVPPVDTQLAWVERVVAEGVRRPGSAADRRVEEWIAETLRTLGIDDVTLEPVELPTWESSRATLTAWPSSAPESVVELTGFALPHTLPADGLEAELVRLPAAAPGPVPGPVPESGASPSGGLAGAIVVDQLAFDVLPQAFVVPMATAMHDPEGEFAELTQVLPFGPRGQLAADPAVAAGAAGYVGVLSGVPWDTCDYYVPYDGQLRPITGLWLDRVDGRRLDELLDAGQPVRGRLDVAARRGVGLSHNVVATLPGASDEWVVVGTHHDAPWASAVEDGTGIALVLAQAAYWAQVPADQRPHNLLFLFTAGHMVHAAGTAAFIASRGDWLDRVVLEVHLEHAAARAEPDGHGGIVGTDEPEVRWWFTSTEPKLERAVAAALAAEDLRRSLVLPPEAFMEHPPTDGGFFHLAGVPLVNFLSAPMYLFDSADTLDKVHQASLEPLTRATVRIIDSLGGRTAADLRGEPARQTSPAADAGGTIISDNSPG